MEEKAQEEREKHKEILDKAKSDLEKFYQERKKKISVTKEENRFIDFYRYFNQ